MVESSDVEIDSTDLSQVEQGPIAGLNAEKVETPQDDDFLKNSVAADPESFNVCISCD